MQTENAESFFWVEPSSSHNPRKKTNIINISQHARTQIHTHTLLHTLLGQMINGQTKVCCQIGGKEGESVLK